MGKASKRSRKGQDRDVQTLKNKQSARPEDALDVWAEGAAELGADPDAHGDSNALIMAPKRKGPAAAAAADGAAAEGQVLSKAEARKLRQVQHKKERRDNICQVFEKLSGSSLSEQQLALLRPLHQRGHKETKKQRILREEALRAAGLGQQLLGDGEEGQQGGQGNGKSNMGGVFSDSEESGSSDSDEDDTRAGMGGSAAAAAAATAAATAKQQAEAQKEDGSSAGGPAMPPAKRARFDKGPVAQKQGQQQNQQQKQAAQQPMEEDEEEGEDAGQQQSQQEQQEQRKALLERARAEARQARAEAGIADEGEEEELADQKRRAAEKAAAAKAGPLRVVHVTRPTAMQEAREKLPIIGMEQEVMEALVLSDVVVLCGETGCGKTTQVPQFLYEAGFGHKAFPEKAGAVGITQPRRVAAISTATRVAAELGSALGEVVGYQVRHDRRVGSNSALAFMTDGILLRQLQDDFLLRRYSCVIIDEAHECALNTDLLLGMLSRVVPLRRSMHDKWVAGGRKGPGVYPLKLIIMSATLRTEDFTGNKRLFPSPPPVLRVPARQFPVTIHFSRRTELHDYVGAAFNKVCRIHRELPPGGILVFLTGQREVEYLCSRLRTHFATKTWRHGSDPAAGASATGAGVADGRDGKKGKRRRGKEASSTAAGAAATAGRPGDATPQAQQQGVTGDDVTGGGDDEGADEYLQFGGDAAEAGGGFAAEAAALAAGRAGERDDLDEMEADEDEEEVQVLGGDQFTPEEIAAAEAHFEERYGLRLGATATNAIASTSTSTQGQQQQGQQGQGQQQQGQQEQQGPAPVHVLPLYAMLPQERQAKVFGEPPAGHRLIVVATNVAETSLTIPGIRYVVDAGRSKQKVLEGSGTGGLSRFEVSWVSKSSGMQRAGRAGRTGPGHCYRLFSSAHFNDTFVEHGSPEIANTALEGVVLVMKAMGVDKVMNFPFPTPPEPSALQAALACLSALGAMEAATGKLTGLGAAMAALPISPRHSRMLLEVALWRTRQARQQMEQLQQQAQQGQQQQGGTVSSNRGDAAASTSGRDGGGGLELPRAAGRALPYAVALAAALSSESPFVHIDAGTHDGDEEDATADHNAATQQQKDELRRRQHAARTAHARFRGSGSSSGGGGSSSADGDAIAALRALCAYEEAGCSDSWAHENFLHARNLKEMADLHRQLARTLQLYTSPTNTNTSSSRSPLLQELAEVLATSSQLTSIASSIGSSSSKAGAATAGLLAPLSPPSHQVATLLRQALAAGWADQVARRVRSQDYIERQRDAGGGRRHATRYAAACLEEEVFLHPRSSLHATSPEYVAYIQIIRTTKRPYMATVTPLEPHWLVATSSPLATISEPLPDPIPFYRPDVDRVLCWRDARYGRHDWLLPRFADLHPDLDARIRVFASALLSGKALPGFAVLQPVLTAQPNTVARVELAGLPRVGELLAALKSRNVDSVGALSKVWVMEGGFLRAQLGAWVQKPAQRILDQLWVQLQSEAKAIAAGKVRENVGAKVEKGSGRQKQQGKRRRGEGR